jgi:tRNA-splicing ligase RtcB
VLVGGHDDRVPAKLSDRVLSWATSLEPQAAAQAVRSSTMPFVHGHVALMPDAHFGLGATVGSVIATDGAVMPAAVGVDIGCGMIAARLELTAGQLPDDLSGLHARIARAIPAGVGKGHDRTIAPLFVSGAGSPPLTDKQKVTAAAQMGSLGSGNHFVELCLDEQDRVWLVLHSGSRGIGNQLATQHIERAKGLMKR